MSVEIHTKQICPISIYGLKWLEISSYIYLFMYLSMYVFNSQQFRKKTKIVFHLQKDKVVFY